MRGKQFYKNYRAAFIILFLLLTICLVLVAPVQAEISYTGYGANRTVSGSFHLVEIDGEKIILDTGSVYEGDYDLTPPLPADIGNGVVAVFLSHAHSDHTGRLFQLLRSGYDGPIYCSDPTAELLPVMLEMTATYSDFGRESFFYSINSYRKSREKGYDAVVHRYDDCQWGAKISPGNLRYLEASRDELEEKGFELCEECVKKEVKEVMDRIITVPLNKSIKISDNLSLQLYYTPHIPGSVAAKVANRKGDELIYSGDLGSGLSPFLQEQEYITSGDFLIIEGTYGVDARALNTDARDEFREFLGDKVREGKRVFIPAFVLDRTQQVLYEIARGKENGQIPPGTPVKLFSPTAYEITKIYDRDFHNSKYLDYFRKDFFASRQLAGLLTWADYGEPQIGPGEIIVCSSGMADTGFAKSFVQDWIDNEDSVFVFVGYQAPRTVGGRLTSGLDNILLDGEDYQVKAEVRRFHCFSSHASFLQIQEFIGQIEGLKKVLIVHSEDYKRLQERYSLLFPGIEFIVPKLGEEISLSD